jgi:ADP-ribose pyrophosphatase
MVGQLSCGGVRAHARAPLHIPSAVRHDGPPSSVARYMALTREAPHLFEQKGDWQQGEISILDDNELIAEAQQNLYAKYASKFPDEIAWAASRAGVVLEDPYVLILREAVRFPNGKIGLYNRKVTRVTLDGGVAGAYCLPILPDGRVVMVKEYRHQERRWRLNIPGGFRDPGESSQEAARREATEETGYKLANLELLGFLDAEGEAVPFFVAPTAGVASVGHADEGEALGGVISVSLSDLRQAVLESGYRDTSGTWLSLQANLGSVILMTENFIAHRLERN